MQLLAGAVEAGNLDGTAAEFEVGGFGEEIDAVERVEAARESARELEMLQLVLAYGYLGSLLD